MVFFIVSKKQLRVCIIISFCHKKGNQFVEYGDCLPGIEPFAMGQTPSRTFPFLLVTSTYPSE